MKTSQDIQRRDSIDCIPMRVSIFSKGKWIHQEENDLFVIYFGENDEDVQVYTSSYFDQTLGSKKLPPKLQKDLETIGFAYDENIGEYYYSRLDGNPISKRMKKRIKRTVLQHTKI